MLELFRLEKALKIIKSNCELNTAKSATNPRATWGFSGVKEEQNLLETWRLQGQKLSS